MNAEIVRRVRLEGVHSAASPTACLFSENAVAKADCKIFREQAVPTDRPRPHKRSGAADAVVELVTFDDRQPIAVAPRPAGYLCCIVKGWAYREHNLRTGARQITDVLVPGDLIPASMIERLEAIACGKARVMILSQDFTRGQSAEAFRSIRDRACEAELRILRARLVSLGRLDARARVAHFFAELHARLDRSGRVEGDAFSCPLTQEQIGDALGLTSVHVNRTLQRLRAEGLLVVSRRRVRIPDVRRLRAAADVEVDVGEFHEGGGHDAI